MNNCISVLVLVAFVFTSGFVSMLLCSYASVAHAQRGIR